MSITKQSFTVFIEGNIASGKTKFLNYLEQFENVCVLKEDVDVWTNFHGFNLLDLKFKKPDYFNFPFQSMATLTRLRQHLKETAKPIKVMERSLISARHCFVKAQRMLDLLHEGMYYVLEEWYDYIDEYHKIHCDLIIYIQTDPEVTFKRIKKRARHEESEITLDYLRAIHKLHERLFIEDTSRLPAEVIVIDGNVDESDLLEEYKSVEKRILNL